MTSKKKKKEQHYLVQPMQMYVVIIRGPNNGQQMVSLQNLVNVHRVIEIHTRDQMQICALIMMMMKCHDLLLYGLVGVNQHKTRLLYFFFFLFLTFSFFHKKQKEKKSTHKKQLHSTSTVFKIHLGFGVFPLPRRQCGSEIKRSPSTIQMWLVQNHPLRTFRLRRLFAS